MNNASTYPQGSPYIWVLRLAFFCLPALHATEQKEEIKRDIVQPQAPKKDVKATTLLKLLESLQTAKTIEDRKVFLEGVGWPSKKITTSHVDQMLRDVNMYKKLFVFVKHAQGKRVIARLVNELQAPLAAGTNKEGGNMLHVAVRQANQAHLTYLCEQRSLLGLQIAKNGRGATLLHTAVATAKQGHEILQYLVKHHKKLGLDPTETDVQRYNLLHTALSHGKYAVFAWLREQNLRLDIRDTDKQGRNLFHTAVGYGDPNMLEQLYKANQTLKQGLGMDPKATDNLGYNLLHTAVASDHIKMVQHIIPKVDTYGQAQQLTHLGENLLHVSIHHGKVDTFQWLHDNHANLKLNPKATTKEGLNLIQVAVRYGQIAALQFLVKKQQELGLSVQTPTSEGANLFHIAVQYEQQAMLKHLWKHRLHYGLAITARTKPGKGQSVLDMANSSTDMQHFLSHTFLPTPTSFDTTKGEATSHLDHLHRLVAHQVSEPMVRAMKNIFRAHKIACDKDFHKAVQDLLPCLQPSAPNPLQAALKRRINLNTPQTGYLVALIKQALGVDGRNEYPQEEGAIAAEEAKSDFAIEQEVVWDVFTTFGLQQHTQEGLFYYNHILDHFYKQVQDTQNGIKNKEARGIYRFLWARIHDKEKQPPNFHRNVVVQDDMFTIYRCLFGCMEAVQATIGSANVDHIASFVLIPKGATKLSDNTTLDYENVEPPTKWLAKLTIDAKATPSGIAKDIGKILQGRYQFLMVLDHRKAQKHLYVYKRDFPTNGSYVAHLAWVKKQLALQPGMLCFTNIYHAQKDVSQSYFCDGEGSCRFFPAYLTEYLPTYFQQPDGFTKEDYIKERFAHAYKHGYPITSCQHDKAFTQAYKKLVNEFFITNNYVRETSGVTYNFSCTLQAPPSDVAQCGYTKYLLHVFKKQEEKEDPSKLVHCFHHLMQKHALFSSTGNKELVKYFQKQIGCCKEEVMCEYIKLHIRDLEANENVVLDTYKDILASVHTYLFHAVASVRNARRNNTKKAMQGINKFLTPSQRPKAEVFPCKPHATLPYYIENCGYAKYLLGVFTNQIQKKDASTLVHCFNHLMQKHELFGIKGNKKIVTYFCTKVFNGLSCQVQAACTENALHLSDLVQNEYVQVNDYEEIAVSVHAYLFHLYQSSDVPKRPSLQNINNVLNPIVNQSKTSRSSGKEEKKAKEDVKEEAAEAMFKVMQIQLGTAYHTWIAPNEAMVYTNLEEEVTDAGKHKAKHKYESITEAAYAKIKQQCVVLYNQQNKEAYTYTLQELIALKLYTDLTDFQNGFRRVFWDVPVNQTKRKYFIQWACTMAAAFHYGGQPQFATLYHGLNKVFVAEELEDTTFYGPISTTLVENQALLFSKKDGEGLFWHIKQQTNKPLALLYGINVATVTRFSAEEEVLLFNTRLPIIATKVLAFDIEDENERTDEQKRIINEYKLTYLCNYLLALSHHVDIHTGFFKKIGVALNAIEKQHVALLWEKTYLRTKLFNKTKYQGKTLIVRLAEELEAPIHAVQDAGRLLLLHTAVANGQKSDAGKALEKASCFAQRSQRRWGRPGPYSGALRAIGDAAVPAEDEEIWGRYAGHR